MEKTNDQPIIVIPTEKTKEQLDEEKKKEEEFLQKLQYLLQVAQKSPELYTKEVGRLVELFKTLFVATKENPLQKNRKFAELTIFLARVAHYYKYDMEFLPEYISQFLDSYFKLMNPFLRKKLVSSYMILRSKNLIPPIKSITFLFRLFNCQDKELRHMLASHIVNDIKRMNKHHKNNQINKQIQNYIFEVLKKNSDTLARRALQIMIQMYKKNYWNDPKTVNIIAQGCFNDYYKVQLTACYFLYETTEAPAVEVSSDEDDEETVGTPYDKRNFSKKTKSKESRRIKDKKRMKRKFGRKLKMLHKQNFFPIDQIFNPQDFCEKLFGVLKKSQEKFQVKIAIMQVLSRMTGRHKLVLLSYYSYLQKYLQPHQKDVHKMLAFLAEATHSLVHPDDMQPIIKHIIDNFVNDRCSEEAMTLGLNTIREMCMKNRFLLEADSLNYLAQYKTYKNRNVSKSAKSLINLFRMINPKLLDKKHRGRDYRGVQGLEGADGEQQDLAFGQEVIYQSIDGADLIDTGNGNLPNYMDKILTDEDFKKIKFLQKKKLEEEQIRQQRLNQNEDDDDDDEEEEEDEEEDDDEEENDEEEDEDEEEVDEEEAKEVNETDNNKQNNKKKQQYAYQQIRGESDEEDEEDEEDEDEEEVEENNDKIKKQSKFKQLKSEKQKSEKIKNEGNEANNEEQEDSDEFTELSELEFDEDDDELEDEDYVDNNQDEENVDADEGNQKPQEDVQENESNKKEGKNEGEESNSKKLKKQNNQRKVRDLEEDLQGFSSFEEEDDEEENPHGFINPGQIGFFRKTKSERKKELREQQENEVKEKKYFGPKQKGGGTTNKEKLKNKPLDMLRPKKNKINKLANALKTNIKDIKNKLGHVKSGKHAKQLKKRKLK